MSNEKEGALALHGIPLAEAGYEVIWIPPGLKKPEGFNSWPTAETNASIVRNWIKGGRGNFNVGVRAKNTPAVDLDIYDEDFAEAMERLTLDLVGEAPVRVGQWPKRLLVYITDKSFTKQKIVFTDLKGDKHAIEILGDGQQFVAYGIHPDTKRPYEWISEKSLEDFTDLDLCTITLEKVNALFDAATEAAKQLGWKVFSRTGNRIVDEGEVDSLEDLQTRGSFTYEELKSNLEALDPDAGYDRWLQIGQALHHYYAGGDVGLELWDTFSQRSLDYDNTELESKWESFNDNRSGRVITARSLVTWAKEARAKNEKENFDEMCALIDACESTVELTGSVIKTVAKKVDSKALIDAIAERIKARTKALGSPVRVDTIRKAIRSAQRTPAESKHLPAWCRHYVYVKLDDKFYNTISHRAISDRAFNAEFNRVIAGDDDNTLTATRFALDTLELPVVDSYIYLPGREPIVDMDGSKYVNRYDDAGVPSIPTLCDEPEDRAVALVKAHFEMLFPDRRERELLISYFAYTVQNPEARIHWAPLIYGGEGVGKTYFFGMMRHVLGRSNTMPVTAKQLSQQFTSWAEGRRLVAFEEIRLTGHSRYDVLEAVKPYLTNEEVDIRRMHTDTYSVPNVTNYLFFTNHGDALPIANGDRRYFILTAALLHEKDRKAFLAAHPGYFKTLFGATKKYAGAILGWLMEYEIHDEFHPTGEAPKTDSKDRMREASQDEGYDELEALIESSPRWDVCPELLCVKSLLDLLRGSPSMDDDEEETRFTPPASNRMKPMLRQLGFVELGRARPMPAGRKGKGCTKQRYWSKTFAPSKKDSVQEYIKTLSPHFDDDLGLD